MRNLNCIEASLIPALLFALATPANAELLPSGEVVEGAIHVDITPEGFDALGMMLPALAPSGLPIDDVSESYGGLLEQCWLGGYEITVSNLTVQIEFNDVSIVPNTGYLDIEISVFVSINDSSDPFFLYTELECIPSDCDAWVEPFEVTAHTKMALDVLRDEEGEPYLDATIDELEVDLDLTGDDVTLDGCWTGDILEGLEWLGLDIIGLILPALDGPLNDVISDFVPEIEPLIEDAFSQAKIDQQFSIQDSTIHLFAEPGDISIKPEGLRLSMDGSAAALDVNDCISSYDPDGSLSTPSAVPAVGSAPAGVTPGHAAGFLLADEFGNQALYALWRSGLLCYTVDEELGFPIDTSILGLLAGEAFNDLFPEGQPMVIETRPREAPVLNFTGEQDVNVLVGDLGLDFMASLDHRMARVLSLALDVNVGVDLGFDGATGDLGIAIDLGADSFDPTVTSNDFVPESTDSIESSFASVFNGLVGGLVGDLLGDMAFSIPGLEGMGLTALELTGSGSGDWLGGYAWLGEVEYASIGCTDGEGGCSTDGEGGCGTGEDGGCDEAAGGCEGGGCASSARSQRRWGLLVFPLFLALLRRRP